ncbi:MAG: hypothetical protein HC933_03825 [Pleurocapsa sp. SU_196_0]|nr:hypothetical protein [Pleurocapsa sp. SU_196_0]
MSQHFAPYARVANGVKQLTLSARIEEGVLWWSPTPNGVIWMFQPLTPSRE